MTSSLFATTVLASFFVVALPHILPCPAPRAVFADGEMLDGSTKRRRRRRPEIVEREGGIVQFDARSDDDNASSRAKASKRECPVPKPKGMLGELLGLTKDANNDPRPRSDS